MDIADKLLSVFESEQAECVSRLRGLLARMREAGAESGSGELEEAVRVAHNLKGAAHAVELAGVASLAERMEALLAKVRDRLLEPASGLADAFEQALATAEEATRRALAKQPPPELAPALEALDRLLEGAAGAERGGAPAELDGLQQKLLAAFRVECNEHLESIRSHLTALEAPDDPNAAGRLEDAFRRAHSLKGAARACDLPAIQRLAHRLETLFSQIREGAAALDAERSGVAQLVLDAIEDAAIAAADGSPEPETGEALGAIERLLGSGGAAGDARPAPAAGAGSSAAEAAETADPAAGAAKPLERTRGAGELGGRPKTATEPVAGKAAAETVRIGVEDLDGILDTAGELLTECLRQDLISQELVRFHHQLVELDLRWERLRKALGSRLRRLSTDPELAPLASYLDFVEQQSRSLSRGARTLAGRQQSSHWALQHRAQELQQEVCRARMTPAENAFQVFRKMVRDLARDEGKKVEFRATGLGTKADRMVLQALKDPLMHILRNTVCHGIEVPEERRRQGKAEVGRVTLEIDSPGNYLRILVDDDGVGIDRERILEEAVRKGQLSRSAAKELSTEAAKSLLFQAGFSTSRQVSDLSGRGMGLSVVYEAVKRLQGEVQILDKQGPGTSMELLVPLAVATHRLLLVAVRAATYAIPTHGIERLLRARLDALETMEGKPTVSVDGDPVPVLGLAQLLNLGDAEVVVEAESLSLVILRSGPRRVAVAVDRFIEERSAIIKDLDAPAAQSTKLSGAILMEDGSAVFVLNPSRLVESFSAGGGLPLLRPREQEPEERPRSILVVDDSFTTRTLESSILETHGFDVELAVDGVEALEKLRSRQIDLVIADIEMPRLDGLGLLAEMKKDAGLSRLPVIIVSSVHRAEVRQRGLDLGAGAYIVKQAFDHQELLETIRQMLP